jgi:putative FmdB family regulatory protein
MPIYAYQCTECHREVEVLQKISDAPLTECPGCQRSSLVKKVTAAGFQLKGSGWYVTDFRGNGSGKPKDRDEKAADSKPADGEVKTEAAKPAEAQPAGSKPAETAAATPASGTTGGGSGPASAASS